MPTYEYNCKNCQYSWEEEQSIRSTNIFLFKYGKIMYSLRAT